MKTIKQNYLLTLLCTLFSAMAFSVPYSQGDTIHVFADRYFSTVVEAEWFDADLSDITEGKETIVTAGDTAYVRDIQNGDRLKYNIFVGDLGGTYEFIYKCQQLRALSRVRLYMDGNEIKLGEWSASVLPDKEGWQMVTVKSNLVLDPGYHVIELVPGFSASHLIDKFYLKPVTLNKTVNPAAVDIATIGFGSVDILPDFDSVYIVGDELAITATPIPGYLFDGWSGDYTGNDNPYHVTLSGDINLTAPFSDDPAIQNYELNISDDPNGVVTVSPKYPSYVSGTNVELTATPSLGYEFTGWTGDLLGTENPVSINIDSNISITPVFNLLPAYTLSLIDSLNTVTRSPDMDQYPRGAEVTIKGGQTELYRFASWLGDTVSVVDEITIKMDSNIVITVGYEGKDSFVPGDYYYLKADAYTTDTIQAEWFDPKLTTASVRLDTIPETDTVYATNLNNTSYMVFPVVVGASGGTFTLEYFYRRLGTRTDNRVNVSLDDGKSWMRKMVPLTAIGVWKSFVVANINLAPGYQEIKIQINASDEHELDFFTLTPVLGTIDVGSILSINFDSELGSIEKDGEKDIYYKGDVVVITATADSGYIFNGWSGYYVGADNPLTVTMDTDVNLTAHFVASFVVTINEATVNGTVEMSPDLSLYPAGASVSFTPKPDAGYQFDGWFATWGVSGTDVPLVLEINRDIDLTAFFSEIAYILTTKAENGHIEKSPNKISYDLGATVELTAVPHEGYVFESWTGDYEGTENPITIAMDSTINVEALFAMETNIANMNNKVCNIYPNPSNGKFNVELSFNNIQYFITDISGRRVKEGIGSESFVIDMTDFKKGIYAISIITKQGVLIRKVMID